MQLIENVRYSLRQFARAPGFTATVVLTVALGIGATTAIFTLVHAVLLSSLPVVKPGELYRIGKGEEKCCVNTGLEDDWSLFSYDQYKTFRDSTPAFASLAAFQAGTDLVGVRRPGTSQPAESQPAEFVSGNYFSTLGIGAFAGRVLTPRDDQKGAEPVAVMNYSAWRRIYGADTSLVGAGIVLDGRPFTLVGIAAPAFFGDRLERPPNFWIPLSDEPLTAGEGGGLLDFPTTDWLDIIGRIKPDASVTATQAQMQAELQQWLLGPANTLEPGDRELVPKQTLHLSPGGDGVLNLREDYASGLHLLMWISGLVLLIGCANVANLMLVRAANRRQQTAIRAALGAPRSRQIAQALTESTLLALLGGAVGVGIAFAGTRLILALAFPQGNTAIDAAPSLPVIGFAFAVSLLTGWLFGLAPAWLAASAHPAGALRGASRSTGARPGWIQQSLVVAQASLSLVLLCAAGLLVLSLRNMRNFPLGFESEHRYVLQFDPHMAGYQPSQLDALDRQLHDSLGDIPGIAHVSLSLYSPMDGNTWGETVYIEGQPPPPHNGPNGAWWVRVSQGYFDALGIKILEGRPITAEDTASSEQVAVVDQAFEKHFFPGQSAIGRHFGVVDEKYAGAYEIVGVCRDARYRWTSRVRPMYFLASTQSMNYDTSSASAFEAANHYLGSIEIETLGDMPGLEPQVRRAIEQVNPDLAVNEFTSLSQQVDRNFSQQDMIAKLTSLFGLIALVLASIGIYGVTAYSVERRTNEIGIRMALGADRLQILKLVLRGAFLQVAIGLAIGIPVTILIGRAIAAQLFGVKPYDPAILLITSAVLGLAAFLAAVVPARRAASLDPMRALRVE